MTQDTTPDEAPAPPDRWTIEPVGDGDLAPAGTEADCTGAEGSEHADVRGLLDPGVDSPLEGMDGVVLPDDDEVAALLAGDEGDGTDG